MPEGGRREVGLSHIDDQGRAKMVDVGGKEVTKRVARAGARVRVSPRTMSLLMERAMPKGDVLATARVAGIVGAKRTSELVPLCHPLPLDQVEIEFGVDPGAGVIEVECTARTQARTGVEMEAITGAAVAAITIYDMCKAVDKGIVIDAVRLLEKTGGKEPYRREEGR
jgi:cyclic pyranopterin phosphate synthase